MTEVTIGGKAFTLPSEWTELSRDQLLFLSSLYPLKLTPAQFKVRLLMRLLRVSWFFLNRLDPQDLTTLTNTLEWIFTDVRLTRNSIPRIGFLHGFSDDMKDCTFGEFTNAQMKVEDYGKSGKEEDLDELVAILYRRKKRLWMIRKHFTDTADCRVRFVEKNLPRGAKRLSRVAQPVKYAVYLNVLGVISTLPDKFPNVYRKKEGGGKGGWAALMLSLADGKTDDESLDKVFYSNMYNVFMGLEQKAIDYFEFKRNTDKHD